MSHYDVLVAGAGHAGTQVAVSLRKAGFTGTLAVLSGESETPYERPPLSKGFLREEISLEELAFRPAQWWQAPGVQLMLGRTVTMVDVGGHRVRTAAGNDFGYGQLVWAAGGRPRPLPVPGADLAGVHSVRTVSDVVRLRSELATARSAVVIGGGYIGLEAASALVQQGLRVTVLEAADRLLARVTSPPVSAFFAGLHREAGVDVRTGTGVVALHGEGGRVRSVETIDGESLPADLVVVGIGLVPNVEVLAEAGADCPNGVRTDTGGRTSLPDVLAAGDCVLRPHEYADGAPIRLESVASAVDQAKTVAGTVLGLAPGPDPVPWFWSHQHDVMMRTAGLLAGYDEVVLRGDPGAGAFSAVYLREGVVVALDCVNRPADFAQGKALVAARSRPAPHLLADTSVPLKTMLKLTSEAV